MVNRCEVIDGALQRAFRGEPPHPSNPSECAALIEAITVGGFDDAFLQNVGCIALRLLLESQAAHLLTERANVQAQLQLARRAGGSS